MIKVTNIKAAKMFGALLILLSANSFAVTYAPLTDLNTEISNRKAGDSAETSRAKAAEGTLNTAITAEKYRSIGIESVLNTAIGAETARAKAAELAATGTKISNGTHVGDTLVWNGTTWAPSGSVYNLGDTGPDGGQVYYVDGSGYHGLEAQPADASSGTQMSWSSALIASAAYNTTTLTGSSGFNCSTSNAQLTPHCWHLPTKTELEYLYEQKDVIAGFSSTYYWSATAEASIYAGWIQSFETGDQLFGNTNTAIHPARAVRAF